MFFNLATGERSVGTATPPPYLPRKGGGIFRRSTIALDLDLPDRLNPVADYTGTFAGGPVIAQVGKGHRRNFHVQVNPVQERAGEFTAVFGNLRRRTAAGFPGITEVTAGASLQNTRANKSEAIVYVVTKHINLKKMANPGYPSNPKTFGQKLRKWRLDNNLTIKALSKIIKADEMSIINWEKRNRTPMYKYVRKIKELTGVEITGGFRDRRESKPELDSLGEKLRQKRLELGLSQEELAHSLSVDISTVTDWEKARHQPTKKSLEKLTKFLTPLVL